MVNGEISVSVNSGLDVINARQRCRWLAEKLGFRASDVTLLSTLVSELARTAIALDCTGDIVIQSLQRGAKKGLSISVVESPRWNPEDPDSRDWTASAMGKQISAEARLLLLASKHVADEFEVRPSRTHGSVVRLVKWL